MNAPQDQVEHPAANLLVRMIVGCVFLLEGIQGLFADALGVGRCVKIGIPAPEVLAPFVAVVEIGCGSLLLVGLLTRLASVPLIVDMLLGSSFLLIAGGGRWSVDTLIERRKR